MNERQIPSDAIPALLGPEGPELTCDECFEVLDRYVEAEIVGLDAEQVAPGMQAHLIGCPACAEDHEALRDYVAAGEERSGSGD